MKKLTRILTVFLGMAAFAQAGGSGTDSNENYADAFFKFDETFNSPSAPLFRPYGILRKKMSTPVVYYENPWLKDLEKQFVKIPAGILPRGKVVAAFEADRYPVTRKLWVDVGMPIPEELKTNWETCLSCPITYVHWENEGNSPAEIQEFLKRLNGRAAVTGCKYDLPTNDQLHYVIRADPAGTNGDPYSAGVTRENVDDYVTHGGNSNGQIQPVGHKKLNSFGIELGNVWKISKDIYSSEVPQWGRSLRGGSWNNDVRTARSVVYRGAPAGERTDKIGFTLIRTCP